MDLKATFWGVRGSVPVPGKNTAVFGGNTSCVQIEVGRRNLIFDGGTGITELGDRMMNEKCDKDIDIFFSHYHWDHIQGLPFFTPFYCPGNYFRLHGPDKGEKNIKKILNDQMLSPYFPITMGMMKAELSFIRIEADTEISLGDGIKIKTLEIDHSDGCLAYRIEKGSSSLVYCTDTETLRMERRKKLLSFITGTDVFIYDANFTEEEYIKLGAKWGHSTWEEGAALSTEAGVGQLVLFHHKRDRADKEQQMIESFAQKSFKNTVAAKEGMIVTVGGDGTEKVVVNYPY